MRDAVQLVGWLALVAGALVCLGGMGALDVALAKILVTVGLVVACVGAVLVRLSVSTGRSIKQERPEGVSR